MLAANALRLDEVADFKGNQLGLRTKRSDEKLRPKADTAAILFKPLLPAAAYLVNNYSFIYHPS